MNTPGLANRIKLLRKHYRLTVKHFAYGCMVSDVTIFKLEKGEKISEKTLQKIADTYGAGEEWLLTGKGEMLPFGIKELPFSEIEKRYNINETDYNTLVCKNAALEKEIGKLWETLKQMQERKTE